MFGPMMNSNLVFVPLIRKGFLRSEFDTTYPMRLNGIINQEEYQNSILNINRALKPDQSSTICVIITAMISFIGIICLMLFGFVVASSHHQNAFLLLSIFLGIAFLGSLGLLISLFNFQSKRVSRMHQAITQESAKYCKKTPIPCSWRSTHPSTTFGNSHSSSGILIEISSNTLTDRSHKRCHFNQVDPQITPTLPPIKQAMTQSPIYEQASVQFCAHCGTAKLNSMATFCTSCGHTFIKI